METMYQEIQTSGKKDQEQADAYREAYEKMMQGTPRRTRHGIRQPRYD